MCTAATYKTNDFYFGRTLDYESSYGEEIVIMPRNFPLNFVNMGMIATHYAVIGTAHVANNYPLFYDAANEKGLAMAEDRKSTRLNSSHITRSRMPSSA